MAQIMLDSGAFSVWKSGRTIDLDDYIRYCKSQPRIGHYVNLDVIPPKHDKETVEDCCKQGWNNYRKMIKTLPQEKVIPVFHLGESIKWLHKYMDAGAKYIGLGGLHTKNKNLYQDWIRKEVIPNINDGIKLHGFAVCTVDNFRLCPWYSVDSTAWMQHSVIWQVLIPRTTRGKPDFIKSPIQVKLSPRSLGRKDHYTALNSFEKSFIREYLNSLSVEEGSYHLTDVEKNYRTADGECWLDSKRKTVIKTIEIGILTDVDERNVVNAAFFRGLSDACSVSNHYFSGVTNLTDKMRNYVSCVLVSYAGIPDRLEEWLD